MCDSAVAWIIVYEVMKKDESTVGGLKNNYFSFQKLNSVTQFFDEL